MKTKIYTALIYAMFGICAYAGSAKAEEIRIVDKKEWVCSPSELLDFKMDYKQCVREGDWSVPGYTIAHDLSQYAKACEKFTIHLNCKEKVNSK